MTAELVAKLGAVDYCGERPCVPQEGMVQIVLALEAPRRRLVDCVKAFIKQRGTSCE